MQRKAFQISLTPRERLALEAVAEYQALSLSGAVRFLIRKETRNMHLKGVGRVIVNE